MKNCGNQQTVELQEFLDRLPASAEVRNRLEQKKSEMKLLRRVLRLAVEAERTTEVAPCRR
jgi:hypothetical protein